MTLITLIQDKKTSGRTLEKDLNFTNMKNYRVFGTIDFIKRKVDFLTRKKTDMNNRDTMFSHCFLKKL